MSNASEMKDTLVSTGLSTSTGDVLFLVVHFKK